MKYVLTVTPENSVQERELMNLGFEQEWDNAPFTFKDERFAETVNMVRQLEYDVPELEWVLEKKEDGK